MGFMTGRLPRDRRTVWFGWIVLGLAVIVCALALSEKRDFQGACVPPKTVDTVGPRIYENHRTITVSAGSIVTVQLGTGAGAGVWPWETPRSSDEGVLKPLPLCFDPTNVSSLPVQLTPFKAVASGTAAITAEAVSGDPSQTFRLDVTVAR
jgi:hypothetical protein